MTDAGDDRDAPDAGGGDIFTDRERTYFDHLCQYRGPLQVVFSLCLAGLVLSLVSLPFYDAGGAASALTIVNVAGLSAVLVGVGFVLWRC